jgi:hypothetical protein
MGYDTSFGSCMTNIESVRLARNKYLFLMNPIKAKSANIRINRPPKWISS